MEKFRIYDVNNKEVLFIGTENQIKTWLWITFFGGGGDMGLEIQSLKIKNPNEKIVERAERIYQKYIDTGYSEGFAAKQRDQFIKQNKQ